MAENRNFATTSDESHTYLPEGLGQGSQVQIARGPKN